MCVYNTLNCKLVMAYLIVIQLFMAIFINSVVSTNIHRTREGNAVTLICKLPTGNLPIVWKYKSTPMENYTIIWSDDLLISADGYSVRHRYRSYSELTVSNVNSKTAGIYACVANGSNVEITNDEIILVKELLFKLNNQMTLPCLVNNDSTANWYFNSDKSSFNNVIKLNFTERFDKNSKHNINTTELNQFDLIIQPVDTSDGGIYDCKTESDGNIITSYFVKWEFNIMIRGFTAYVS